jgi:RNA polymerase sigma-70 factor (ECF subfamily)
VKDLEPRRRAAFLLFEVEGFTHREVGDILGVPEGTSKTLLFEARRELQRRLWKRGVVPGVGV